MGPRAVRITAEDFMIPAEFGELRLAEHSAGQIGGVHLTLVEQQGRTCFGSTYQQVPLRVLPPFQFPGELASLVYLLNPTAGLLDGDGHLVEIDARPGSCAVVTGQSSTRIHPAVRSFATQQWRVKAAADSQLVLLPGPNIPFRGCRYHQKAEIDLDRGARLIWGDIWTPGRYARVGQEAEFHQFERIVQDLEVRRDGGLVFRDHFTWDGPWDKEQGPLVCGRPARSRERGTVRHRQCRTSSTWSRRTASSRGSPAGPRRHLDSLVRTCPRAHAGPGQDRSADRRALVRRSASGPLADRIEPPRAQPLVLDPGVNRRHASGSLRRHRTRFSRVVYDVTRLSRDQISELQVRLV